MAAFADVLFWVLKAFGPPVYVRSGNWSEPNAIARDGSRSPGRTTVAIAEFVADFAVHERWWAWYDDASARLAGGGRAV